MSQEEVENENENNKDKSSFNNNENCSNREEGNNNINENDKKPEENEAPEVIEMPPFSYFVENTNGIIDQSIFEGEKGKYKYCICLLMKDDCAYNSQLLYKTLKGIEMNLNQLEEELDIKGVHIALFIFINIVKYNYFFSDENRAQSEEKNNDFPYLMKERQINEDNFKLLNLKVYTISNNYYLSDIKALKLYYSFLKQLKDENKLMFSSVITAGIYPLPESLLSLIQFSYHTDNKHGVAVGPIEFKPNDFISKISLYEKIHFNIYNMNYYFESLAVPISSLLCTMCFDQIFLEYLNTYYESINENATIDYHDYNLALKLIRAKNRKFLIKYNYDKALGMIDMNGMTYFDYQKEWIDRNSGYYGNFFEILRSFVDFKMCKPGEKIFMFFQIIAICIEFILPSLFSMVIYAIFYEAFLTSDYRVALFFTTLYLCMMFASGVCSLITKEPKRMTITNYFLYIFMEVFYAFVIICSIPAMHHVNKEKTEYKLPSDYKFNKAAASVLIILSFIIYIIPMILKATVIGNNFFSMLLYLLLGASCSTSNFNIAKIWNASDTSGGKYLEAKKSVCIIIHLCFNLFFGSLSFYNTNRKKRANCIMGFGIMFLIYSFFRTLAIIVKMTCNKEESFDNKKLCSNIKEKLEKDEIDVNQEEEVNNEQKKNNDVDKEENNEDKEQNGNNTEDIQNNEENQNQEENQSQEGNQNQEENQNQEDNENQEENQNQDGDNIDNGE